MGAKQPNGPAPMKGGQLKPSPAPPKPKPVRIGAQMAGVDREVWCAVMTAGRLGHAVTVEITGGEMRYFATPMGGRRGQR